MSQKANTNKLFKTISYKNNTSHENLPHTELYKRCLLCGQVCSESCVSFVDSYQKYRRERKNNMILIKI